MPVRDSGAHFKRTVNVEGCSNVTGIRGLPFKERRGRQRGTQPLEWTCGAEGLRRAPSRGHHGARGTLLDRKSVV